MKRALVLLIALSGCGDDSAPSTANNATAAPAEIGATRIAPVMPSTIAPIEDEQPRVAFAPPTPAPPPPRPAMPAYRAIGTEPFWAVTVRGTVATLERPDKPPVRFAVARSDDARAIRYLGEGFAMTLTPGPCSDGMSDAIWSDRAQVAFGEGTLKGCGGARTDQPLQSP